MEKCLKQDGEKVRKGEVIALYETSRRKYQYAIALAALREAETELELERQNAFSDESKLGKVKLLQERCKMLKVPVEEAQWYLQHTEIHAPASGILALTDKRAELLAGKAVKTGEKLFEVLSNDGLIALIHVNEQESSLLQGDFSVKLFLHTAPEKAVEGTVEECSAYPVLTEQNLYCYPVRVRLKKDDTLHLKVGMRGVAKLSGRKRFLGYLFFKNIILYFRNL
ncbi:MAG: HlyD family efflux transporter periplasmic adaptor subunit [Lentisphaeria bacterium]|nr:HlyD family efflux transporter periplasmic adaptor subunit [Lentisphaeria bacterium]